MSETKRDRERGRERKRERSMSQSVLQCCITKSSLFITYIAKQLRSIQRARPLPANLEGVSLLSESGP